MDLAAHRQVCSLIEELTHSGEAILDEANVKQLKNLCKRSNANVKSAFEQLQLQLAEDHAQIRLAATQLIIVLMDRSALFRQLQSKAFQQFIALSVGHANADPLPKPKKHAGIMRQASLRAIHRWQAKYGQQYKQIKLGYDFLRKRCKVNFADLDAETEADALHRQQRRDQEAREQQQTKQRIEAELQDSEASFAAAAAELQSATSLLIDAALSASSEQTSPKPLNDMEQLRELIADQHRDDDAEAEPGPIDKLTIRTTDDNAVLVEAALEQASAIVQQSLPQVEQWLSEATRVGCSAQVLQRASALQQALKAAIDKFDILHITNTARLVRQPSSNDKADSGDDDDDDDDFVDATTMLTAEQQQRLPLTMARAKKYNQPATTTVTAMSHNDLESTRTAVPATPANAAASADTVHATLPLPSRQPSLPPGNHADIQTIKVAGQDVFIDRFHIGARSFSRRRQTKTGKTASSKAATSASNEGIAGGDDATLQTTNGHTSAQRQANDAAAADSTSATQLLASAPVREFDTDLEHWGQEGNMVIPTGVMSLDNFWSMKDEDDLNIGHQAAQLGLTQRTRYATRTTAERPVYSPCLAPLGADNSDGTPKLCPRRDQSRCPIHGPKIPRHSTTGKPLKEHDERQPEPEKKNKKSKPAKLIDVKRKSTTAKLLDKTRKAVITSIDPALDKLRKEKFMSNWNAPE
eukprot:TRINITY_DN11766_c0_g1_i1.p1 TRINITY_DN11766_c0_g1~~TRINITY_DN11766_c0_g1_i1.p1  ORF type:complete len:697 (+),score=189.39 TRINITY_DN11766_c0_g1_i1:352-2442(+)